MARYSIGFITSAPAANAPACAFRAPTNNARVWEVGFGLDSATTTQIALCRNTAAGYTATVSTSVGQQFNPLEPNATGLVDTSWSTPPTVTTASMFKRNTCNGATGAGVIWTFPEGLLVRSATATDILVLWHDGGGTVAALDGYIVWSE